MSFNVNELNSRYDFNVKGTSYIVNPKNNTVMYIAKKVEYLFENLMNSQECLVFAETGITIPSSVVEKNCVIECDNPQLEYVNFIEKNFSTKTNSTFSITKENYFVGDNVSIGDNAYIEAGCVIGPNVVIGMNAVIYSGAVIRNAVIGDNFIANENAVIGTHSFTMTRDADGNRKRIPTMGKVVIGDNVEIGPLDNITAGQAGDTYIGDYTKLGSLIEIGHDDNLGKNVELAPTVSIGGASDIMENVYIGLNATIKNRIRLNHDCYIGMGSNVLKEVEPSTTMIGNPAKPLVK